MGDRGTSPDRDPARHHLVQSAHSTSKYPELSTQLSSIYGVHSLDSMPADDRNSLIKLLDDTVENLGQDDIAESTETGSSFMYNEIFRYVVHRRDEARKVDCYRRINFKCNGSTDLVALKTREDVAFNQRQTGAAIQSLVERLRDIHKSNKLKRKAAEPRPVDPVVMGREEGAKRVRKDITGGTDTGRSDNGLLPYSRLNASPSTRYQYFGEMSSLTASSSQTNTSSIGIRFPDSLARFSFRLDEQTKLITACCVGEYKQWPYVLREDDDDPLPPQESVWKGYHKNEIYTEALGQQIIYLCETFETCQNTFGFVALGTEFQRLKMVSDHVVAIEVVDKDRSRYVAPPADPVPPQLSRTDEMPPDPDYPQVTPTSATFALTSIMRGRTVTFRDYLNRHSTTDPAIILPWNLIDTKLPMRHPSSKIDLAALSTFVDFAGASVAPWLSLDLRAISDGKLPGSLIPADFAPNQHMDVANQYFDLFRAARERRKGFPKEDWSELQRQFAADLEDTNPSLAGNGRGPPGAGGGNAGGTPGNEGGHPSPPPPPPSDPNPEDHGLDNHRKAGGPQEDVSAECVDMVQGESGGGVSSSADIRISSSEFVKWWIHSVDLDQPGFQPADASVPSISCVGDDDVPGEAPNALLTLVNRLDIRLLIVSPPEMDILLTVVVDTDSNGSSGPVLTPPRAVIMSSGE